MSQKQVQQFDSALLQATIWKTIRRNPEFKTGEDYCNSWEDEEQKQFIDSWARDITTKKDFLVFGEDMEIDVVKVNVGDLGFIFGTRYDKICERAQKRGLTLLPPWATFEIRRNYLDQPKEEWILVGMKAIKDSDGYWNIFNVERNSTGLWVNSNNGNPGFLWHPLDQFFFARLHNPLYFPPLLVGFYFIDLIHPPIILPTSSIRSESKIYFLSFSDRISHTILRKNFRTSSFWEVTFKEESFSNLSE